LQTVSNVSFRPREAYQNLEYRHYPTASDRRTETS
jgi:hypothetical protein